MIIKTLSRIHSKYFKFFKFFFFLRYILTIFLIAISLFLIIPKFLNYGAKHNEINKFLINYYNFEVESYDSIKFHIFPSPHLKYNNTSLKFDKYPFNANVKEMNIFLNLKNIYNFENFAANKIYFNNSELSYDIQNIRKFLIFFNKIQSKFKIKNSKLIVTKNNNNLLVIKNMNFSNYGFKKI